MKRVGSIREVIDVNLELPAGAAPYEEFDFEPYSEEARNEEELRKTWRVFTKVKDVLDNGRRLENASWRLWFKERRGTAPPLFSPPPPSAPSSNNFEMLDAASTLTDTMSPPPMPPPPLPPPPRPTRSDSSLSSLERYDLTLDANLRRAEEETDRIVGDMFGGVGQRFQKETARVLERAKAERTRALIELADRHSMSDAILDDVLAWANAYIAAAADDPHMAVADAIPVDARSARAYLDATHYAPRPRVAAFCHSLERNGANNFLLYLVRELRDDMSFTLVAPKDGPMRADYEAIGVRVTICNMKLVSYGRDVRAVLSSFQYAIANTIMTTEVVHAARDLGVPCLWVIHEAWPRDQLDYYAKEVFMMTHLNAATIVGAFANASKIVFPARVQRRCYEGLFDEGKSRVIYNGIPLASINAFRTVQSRDAVRADLGYRPDDFLLVHMGTVCRRKAQLISCQAFAELHASQPCIDGKRLKLLIVGARYIRAHEVEYIDECRQTLEAVGAEEDATILDVKKNVLPYYLAADIVLCPSINEVLPLVICEAMAFERPVIASRIDGIPEAMTDGVEGILVEPGNVAQLYDSIERLMKDDDLRQRMGAAGRKRVLSQFSFSAMSKTYRDTIGVDLKFDLTRPNEESNKPQH